MPETAKPAVVATDAALDPAAFFEANPDIETLEAFIVDVNGVLRGKRIPRSGALKVFKDGIRLPRSIFAVDIWGHDALEAGLVTETGDNDGVCRAVAGTLARAPWLEQPTAQVMLTMEEGDGRSFFADPRQVLKRVLGFYAKEGLTPVVAAELEFYLIDGKRDERGFPQPPLSPRTGRRVQASQMYGIGEVQEFAAILTDINRACIMQEIPADTTISENGPGQYEINLLHVADALRAADQATLLKRIIKGVARRYGMEATFMAKPYGDKAGNGMHVHFSVLDKDGNNIFAGTDNKGSDKLRHAIGGLMATMTESSAIFAPNYNSYRRFQPGSHAPTRIAWGYDNRTAALRVPESDLAATRIEHRVSGADANPYLAIAAMLAGAFHGISGNMDPGAPLTGNVYESQAKHLPDVWEDALEIFEQSGFAEHYFGKKYRHVYHACKWQEKELLERQVSSIEHDAYLRDL